LCEQQKEDEMAITTTELYESDENDDEIELSSDEDDESNIYFVRPTEFMEPRRANKNISAIDDDKKKLSKKKKKKNKNSAFNAAIRAAAMQGLNAMIDLYERKEPEILRKGQSKQLKIAT
jgi:hypothetical protein